MKRITLFTVFFIFFISSWAQTRMVLSFTANPSVNWMNTANQEVNKQKVVLGYDFGLLGDIYFSENEHYSFLTGLQVLNTGGNLSYRTAQPFSFAGAELPPSTEIRYRLRYLEIPLCIKLKTDQIDRFYFWGQFGLSPMINIGANGDTSDGTFKRANINEEINMFNLAMNVGAGVDFELGTNNSISAGLIFQNGLSDVTTDNAFKDKTILNSLKIRLALIF